MAWPRCHRWSAKVSVHIYQFLIKSIHHTWVSIILFSKKSVPIILVHMPIFRSSISFSFCWVIVTIEELGISSVVYFWKIHEAGFFDCKRVKSLCQSWNKSWAVCHDLGLWLDITWLLEKQCFFIPFFFCKSPFHLNLIALLSKSLTNTWWCL